MLWFWRTLVAEAYPLICPVASSACSDQNQLLEPGCWFSRTIGLLAASCALAVVVAAQANRPSRAVTTIRRSRIDAAPSPPGPPAPYLARCGSRETGHLSLRWRGVLVSDARGRRSHRGDQSRPSKRRSSLSGATRRGS